ncbi:MAG: LamG domain-containing protein [Planctomycetia bacterium]|nr:LamG domain-containing protein [Planctomycetia bacterium]
MAWQFDGQDDYAALADAPALAFPEGPWTVSGWFCRTNNAGASYQSLMSWGGYSGQNSFNWRIAETDTPTYANQLEYRLRDVDDMPTYAYSGAETMPVGLWRHILLYRSGTKYFRQYVDGVLQGSSTRSGFYYIDRPDALVFGAQSDLAAGTFFPGMLAEWAKWNRALSAAEIAVLAAGATPDWFAAGLAWYLPMRKDSVELVRNLPVKLIGAAIIDHPRRFQPAPMGWAARAQGVGE